ncbi:helix-turn-helix transcriptional regulator [Parerythrobacter aestuarii]|uniref:helix-turn-helix transcriptional regulator n=1 Tax=Parerythrobacter aestuarii TaxID=3020909 RepID=UPI0024DE74B7|nr:sigma factor-like helix-turn-helix DNA-binding protein [Parerythrobacter aestuarii]
MGAPQFGTLTDRQKDVLVRIDRRMPIKQIAGELDVSESRINQHIRALKDAYSVENLKDLVDSYRAEVSDSGESAPYRKPASTKSEVPPRPEMNEPEDRVAPGEFVLSDVAPLAIEAPWTVRHEPRVVPGVLDGDHAVLYRLAVIIGLALAFIVLVILVVTAALSVSEASGGKQYGPRDQTVQTETSEPTA